MSRLSGTKIWVALTIVVLTAGGAVAEDVEKKWRFSFSAGSSDARDEVRSDAANFFVLTDEDDVPIQGFIFEDPRNDQASFGALTIESGPRASLAVQYAVTKIFIVELSAGYQVSDVGDIEVQAQFDNVVIDPLRRFDFRVFPVRAGELEQIPVQATALVRFRPRAKLNPYAGVGFGYTFVGFKVSDELNTLSQRLDNSVGGFAQLRSFGAGISTASSIGDLEGANVDVRDTWTWHAAGGMEFQLKRKWALFFDLRWQWAARAIFFGFNGSDGLGISVRNERDFLERYTGTTIFGPYQITQGGLVDGGRLVPGDPSAPPDLCETTPSACVFEFTPDGELDTGFYYVQGGEVDYNNVTYAIGIRYTF